MTKTAKTHCIIHGFALAHALTCFFLQGTSMGDAILLTCLTIAMVVMLVLFYGGPLDVMVGLLLLACLSGFYLGTKGAGWIQRLFPEMGALYTHVLTTALVTEVLGWSLYYVIRRKNR